MNFFCCALLNRVNSRLIATLPIKQTSSGKHMHWTKAHARSFKLVVLGCRKPSHRPINIHIHSLTRQRRIVHRYEYKERACVCGYLDMKM